MEEVKRVYDVTLRVESLNSLNREIFKSRYRMGPEVKIITIMEKRLCSCCNKEGHFHR